MDIVRNTGEGTQVGCVSFDFVHLVDEGFLEEQLADVLDARSRESVGAVLGNGPIDVDGNMDVGRTRGVISWEDRKELGDTVLVSCSEPVEERLVISGSVRAECHT